MHDAIAMTCLVAARIEARPWLRPPPTPAPRQRRRPTRALGALLVAIARAVRREPDLLDPAAPRGL